MKRGVSSAMLVERMEVRIDQDSKGEIDVTGFVVKKLASGGNDVKTALLTLLLPLRRSRSEVPEGLLPLPQHLAFFYESTY